MKRLIPPLLLIFLFLVNPRIVFAQDSAKLFIEAESGFSIHSCESKQYGFIRGSVDVSTYGINESDHLLNLSYQKWHVGTKTEFKPANKKFSLVLGVRFSQSNSILSKSGGNDDNTSFFYLLNKQEGTTTEYLKVKKVVRNSNYIGLPFEIKRNLFDLFGMKFYVKGGTEISYLLNTHDNVVFYNNDMEVYETDVSSKFSSPNKWLVMMYLSGGVTIGNPDKMHMSIESFMPSIFVSKQVSGLVEPQNGSGIQASVKFPF